jgi:hypothetical protein
MYIGRYPVLLPTLTPNPLQLNAANPVRQLQCSGTIQISGALVLTALNDFGILLVALLPQEPFTNSFSTERSCHELVEPLFPRGCAQGLSIFFSIKIEVRYSSSQQKLQSSYGHHTISLVFLLQL